MGMRWLVGLVLLAIISLILAWVGPISAPAQSERMEASVQNALNDAGLGSVTVEMKGNVAHLSGEAMSEEMANDAMAVAKSAKCEDCKNSSPQWHRVKSAMTVVAPPPPPVIKTVSPFIFSATKREDGSVILDGYVSNENELNRVLREANALFDGNVQNTEITVAQGAPNAVWGDMISKYLPMLANLKKGSFVLNDTQSLFTGTVADEVTRNQVIEARDDSSGYNEVVNLTVPNVAPVFAGTVSSQELCQKLFNELKEGQKINFGSNSDVIGSDSFGLLDSLTSAAKQCPAFGLKIDGHTDNDGVPIYNVDLSQRRAQRVVDYLVLQGIDESRLESEGFGQSKPIASNDTPEGKAANRRIEFTVTKSE